MTILQHGSKGLEVEAWQRTLNAHGAKPPLKVDSVFGDATERATKTFQRENGLLDDGEVGDITRAAVAGKTAASYARQGAKNSLSIALLLVATSQLGTKEESTNRGAGIAKYWPATSYPDGMKNREPWCAAFVCWVVLQAFTSLGLAGRSRPVSASVGGILAWAQTAQGVMVINPRLGFSPLPGDLVVYAFGGDPDHIGICETFIHGVSAPVQAIEGNTNDDGGREGVEVARRARVTASVRAYIRFAEVAS